MVKAVKKDLINEATEVVSCLDIAFYIFEVIFLSLFALISGYASFCLFLYGEYFFAILLAVICLIFSASVIRTLKHKSLAGDIYYSSFL